MPIRLDPVRVFEVKWRMDIGPAGEKLLKDDLGFGASQF